MERKKIRPRPVAETKAQAFTRIMRIRQPKALDDLRKLKALAHIHNYDGDLAVWKEVIAALRKAVDDLEEAAAQQIVVQRARKEAEETRPTRLEDL